MNGRTIAALCFAASLGAAPMAYAHGDEHPKEAHPHDGHADGHDAKSPAAGSGRIEIAGHVAELATADDGVDVTITEKGGEPPESATDAKLILQVGTEKKTIALEGKDGRFHGQADLKGVTKLVAVLQVKLDGKMRTGRFTVERPAAPAAPEKSP